MEPVDPVSGNPIPPGSLPQEVRDNVEADLSEGEYVLPADVVRYFGLDYIEKLVKKAKTGLEQLQQEGRIGGKSEDDLPFTPEELDAHEAEMVEEAPTEPLTMAVGGYVPPPMGVSDETTQGPINPATGLPWWMSSPAQPATPANPASRSMSGSNSTPHQPLTGLAGNPDQWSVKDFTNYADNRGSGINKIIETGVSKLIPFGKLGIQHRNNYLNKSVPVQLEKMIKSGLGTKGEKLTPEAITQLKATLDKLKTEGEYTPGIAEGLKDLFKKSEKKESEKKPTATTTNKSSTTSPTKKPEKKKLSEGGFITRR